MLATIARSIPRSNPRSRSGRIQQNKQQTSKGRSCRARRSSVRKEIPAESPRGRWHCWSWIEPLRRSRDQWTEDLLLQLECQVGDSRNTQKPAKRPAKLFVFCAVLNLACAERAQLRIALAEQNRPPNPSFPCAPRETPQSALWSVICLLSHASRVRFGRMPRCPVNP